MLLVPLVEFKFQNWLLNTRYFGLILALVMKYKVAIIQVLVVSVNYCELLKEKNNFGLLINHTTTNNDIAARLQKYRVTASQMCAKTAY